MKRPSDSRRSAITLIVCAALAVPCMTGYSHAQDGEEDPQTRVGIPGLYVRQAATKEGVVVMGYRAANMAIGKQWMSLDIAMTVLPGFNTKFSREDVSLRLPDDTMLPLASREEFMKNRSLINSLNTRAEVQGDSLNYLPARALLTCIIGFFPDPLEQTGILTRDVTDLDPTRGCLGRFYFQIEDGIELGQHYLLVRLVDEDVIVPFRIMTKDEAKEAQKKLKAMRKEEKAKRKAEKKAKKAEG